ncbi:NADPH-dependent FMN reductase [Bacillus sp. UNC41MFS5]|uniref:NADPH-dependent FMN reductase n=1 Tax=Bacillus sp. UNC41MFS5 TaxID=1449046 RepID=UPI0005530E17|nr:NADPH-dependent FMN reductase [Bacillus sp. UNC41MFS5]
MSKITIISGSPSEQTRLTGVLAEVVRHLEGVDIIPDIIHVRTLPAQDLIEAKFNSEEIVRANKKVEASSIIVILTPVYKASFTGVLKTYLDLLPQNGLEGKTVLPIAIGGTFGHLLMIDYALKPVLAALGATNILKGAFILDSQIKKIENNQYKIDDEAKNRLEASLNILKNSISPDKDLTSSIV